uniref:Four helix bundle protein n=1 Tax=candidate division WWE3 bacterium TaxID=2053526 RepID=A0A831Z0I7_UNCKA
MDARSSLGELQSQLTIAKDLTFLTEEKFRSLWAKSTKVDVILNGLINKTRSLKEK